MSCSNHVTGWSLILGKSFLQSTNDFYHMQLDHVTCHTIWCIMTTHINRVTRKRFLGHLDSKLDSVPSCQLHFQSTTLSLRRVLCIVCAKPHFSWQRGAMVATYNVQDSGLFNADKINSAYQAYSNFRWSICEQLVEFLWVSAHKAGPARPCRAQLKHVKVAALVQLLQQS